MMIYGLCLSVIGDQVSFETATAAIDRELDRLFIDDASAGQD